MPAEQMTAPETSGSERRDGQQHDKRILGHVVQCDGARAILAAFADTDETNAANRWTVGRLISINLGSARTVGLVYEVSKPDRAWSFVDDNAIHVSVELVGEVRDGENGAKPTFDRGITQYPHIGAFAHRIRQRDLQSVYDLAGRHSVTIGNLSQDATIDANIAIDDTLTRHFAVVGTTGVGKSTAVSLLMRKAVEARPDLRILVLDPHNEFASALRDKSVSIDTNNLDLPFWMFRLEEIAEVLFRGRDIITEEVDLLRDLIPLAKQIYRNGASAGGISKRLDATTADTPIPYRMADLIKLIDERMGALDGKTERPHYRMLKIRLEAAVVDPRYRFMFGSRMIEDTIHETIAHIFRVEDDGKPIACFEMAGLPSEVVNAVCSVLARLAFEVTQLSEGRLKVLLMCEEAHRYLPADLRLGFAPTRASLSRIAKEGRKYGCYLGIVTQRPGELDPTIISQCSTVFAMRLANEHDQAIIRSAIADSSASSLSFLSSMGQREAIAFGEGVATTMRLKFETLSRDKIPGLNRNPNVEDAASPGGKIDLYAVVERMRNAHTIHGAAPAETAAPAPAASPLLRAESGLRSAVAESDARRQFSDLELKRPSKPALSDEDPNFGYGGGKAGAFGNRFARS